DTGIHAQGSSRAAAEKFMLEHTALSPENIENEIDRYIVWPGQALAYKTGQLAIVRSRRRAESELGDAFDLVVHFHGHRPALKELGRSGEDLVLLGVSLGLGKAYGPPFADASVLETLVQNVERSLGKQHGRTACTPRAIHAAGRSSSRPSRRSRNERRGAKCSWSSATLRSI